MTPMRTVRCVGAAAVVALAVACSKSSTAPSDPFAGNWSVAFPKFIYNGDTPPDTGTITPDPFTLTLTKGGVGQAAYMATWPLLTWSVTVQIYGALQVQIPASSAAAGTITVSGDTLTVHIPESSIGSGCEVDVQGVFTGSSAHGVVAIVGGNCGTLGGAEAASGSWTATKQ